MTEPLTIKQIAEAYIDDQLKEPYRGRLRDGLKSAITYQKRLAATKTFESLLRILEAHIENSQQEFLKNPNQEIKDFISLMKKSKTPLTEENI